jgi:hypothetical protein
MNPIEEKIKNNIFYCKQAKKNSEIVKNIYF